MHRVVRLMGAGAVVALALATPRLAHAQGGPNAGFTVDEALAKKGKSLFQARGCSGCHTIGKGKMAGPDLAHVTERRTIDWLKSWLKDPPAMIETDSTAKALAGQFNNMKMPNLKLTDDESMALVNHIANESKKIKKSEK